MGVGLGPCSLHPGSGFVQDFDCPTEYKNSFLGTQLLSLFPRLSVSADPLVLIDVASACTVVLPLVIYPPNHTSISNCLFLFSNFIITSLSIFVYVNGRFWICSCVSLFLYILNMSNFDISK